MRRTSSLLAIALALGLIGQGAPSDGSATTIGDPTEGRLLTREGDKTIDVPLKHTAVEIAVDGHIATAEVTQTFINETDRKIEAVYQFPLPGNAAVGAMSIVTGNKTIEGTIERRTRAERVYKAAKKKGKLAALLTQKHENVFVQSVANIEPGAEIKIAIRYSQSLRYENGGYELVFPMVAPPRYAGRGEAPKLQTLRPGHEVSLAVDINGRALSLESPTHAVKTTGAGSSWRAALTPAPEIANRDFVLRFQVAGDEPSLALHAHRSNTDDGAFFLTAIPPRSASAEDIAARELIIVLDTSSSMRGAPLSTAKTVVRRLLSGLSAHDTFQVVQFADRTAVLGEAPIANKVNNVAIATEWLSGLTAGGGTEMIDGLREALATAHDPGRLRIVVFVSDGFIGDTDEVLEMVGDNMGDARLFPFGVGPNVNRFLLDEMALAGRGSAQFVTPSDDAEAAADALYARLDAPILTDIEIDWAGLSVWGINPNRLPDLFAGQPLVVAGRYREAGTATIKVRAKAAGRDVAFEVPVDLPELEARPAVAAVWARRTIADLTRAEIRRSDPLRIEAITQLALEHELLSRYTAFVATDEPTEVDVEVTKAAKAVRYGVIGNGWGSIGTGVYGSIGYGSSFASGQKMVAPKVIVRRGVIRGDLPKTVIRNHIKRKHASVRYCYEKALMTNSKLAGTATVKFTVAPNGTVEEAAVSGMGDNTLHQCIANIIKATQFPSYDETGKIVVSYPFILKPSGLTKSIPVKDESKKESR